MFKKISRFFLLCFLLSQPLMAEIKTLEYSAKKIADIPLSSPLTQYIYQHQNQIYTIQDKGKIKHWLEKEKEWEDFNKGLADANLLYSDGKTLYATSHSGIYFYNFKSKQWENLGHLSENLTSYALSKSGNKLTSISHEGVYQLDSNQEWKKIPSQNPAPRSYEFWGMSNEMIVISSGNKIYAYAQEQKDWLDVSANIENEIGSSSRIQDLMVIGKTFYIGLKEKGVFKRDFTKDKEWVLFNEGISKDEKFLHFSMPYEELIAYTDKQQYKLNSKKNIWTALDIGLENLKIITLTQNKNQIFAASKLEVILKEEKKIERIHHGLNSANPLTTLTKTPEGFLLGSLHGLFEYNNTNQSWKNLKPLFSSPNCNQGVYPVLINNNTFWIGTETGGVYTSHDLKSFEALRQGMPSIVQKDSSDSCSEKKYELIYRLIEFQNKIYALTPKHVYELGPQKIWKQIFSFPKTKGKNTEYSEICCVTSADSKLYMGTTTGLYEFDGKNPFKKINISGKEAETAAYHVASNPNWVAFQIDASNVYRYHFREKEWEYLAGNLPSLEKLIVHQNRLFSLSNKKIFVWNEEEKNWDHLRTVSVTSLWGEKFANQKDIEFFKDMISDGEHLYLLSSEGIFEISEQTSFNLKEKK